MSLSQRVISRLSYTSDLRVILCAASLARHGRLGSVSRMGLRDVDLTSVPAEHLASLVSKVTGRVTITCVSDCVNILDNVKSEELDITDKCLGSKETWALVRAMESGVEYVLLSVEVTLDIRVLMEYSGQGKCKRVECYWDTAVRYREQLTTWTTSKNWAVTCDDDENFYMKRIEEDLEEFEPHYVPIQVDH